jgi:hypothetical protein
MVDERREGDDVYEVKELEILHARLAVCMRKVVDARAAVAFEEGCVYSLKRVLGHDTTFNPSPDTYIRSRFAASHDRLLTPPSKHLVTQMCILTHDRIRRSRDEFENLILNLAALRTERELLERELH